MNDINKKLHYIIDSHSLKTDQNFKKLIKSNEKSAKLVTGSITKCIDIQESRFNSVSESIDANTKAIENFHYDVTWKLTKISSLIEEQNAILNSILEGVYTTETVKEIMHFKKNGDDYLAHNLPDEALHEYFKVLKRRNVDYIIPYIIGKIYLFKKNIKLSNKYFIYTIKYAEAYNANDYLALSYLHRARIAFIAQKYDIAIKFSLKAIQYDNNLSQAYYDVSKYQCHIGEFEKAMNNLEIAVNQNKYYAIDVIADFEYKKFKAQVEKQIENICYKEDIKVKELVNKIQDSLNDSKCIMESVQVELIKHSNTKMITHKKFIFHQKAIQYYNREIESMESKYQECLTKYKNRCYINLLDIQPILSLFIQQCTDNISNYISYKNRLTKFLKKNEISSKKKRKYLLISVNIILTIIVIIIIISFIL
ncbi:hypothetical protein MHK_009347 [Candidatus Magnetomorum sp. HK-1]|nr:hypothetical protein MHK_009347 [Candidatus Magnetomorum sp. HK-1]